MNKRQDRAQGALMGAFIGESLGVGPHWYYDLDKLRDTYGDWIDDYTEPSKGWYHDGMRKGELSQQGWIIRKMAKNLVDNGGYDEADFKRMMDEEILPEVSTEPMAGRGGYTSQMMRHLREARVNRGKDWGDVASIADTTESLERNIPTAIHYANDLTRLSTIIAENTALTQSDNVTGSLTVAYHVVLASLIGGEKLDGDLSGKLMKKVHDKALPFVAVTAKDLGAPVEGRDVKAEEGLFASPDALLSPSHMARTADDPSIRIEPAWKASMVYGMPCAIYHMLPAAYYLAARFKDDFESGVLHAINGGGQNQVRAMLTGALIGAQAGLSAIPRRFIDGLEDSKSLLALAENLSRHL